jgi:hypothetical protein
MRRPMSQSCAFKSCTAGELKNALISGLEDFEFIYSPTEMFIPPAKLLIQPFGRIFFQSQPSGS